MSHYRLYCIRDGRFISFEEFEAEDDSAAVAQSAGRCIGMAAELWSGTRMVHMFPAG